MVETNVHFPTDINLLFDAIRKVIMLTAELCDRPGLSEWRQSAYNVRHVKRLMRSAQSKKRTRAKTDEQSLRALVCTVGRFEQFWERINLTGLVGLAEIH